MNKRKRTVGIGVGIASMLASFSFVSSASADVPDPWQKRQSHCDTLSFYSVPPPTNPNAVPTHLLGGHKRLYYTSGAIQNGWVPVYSAGQEEWHTGWVRGECLSDGWPFADGGQVIY